MNIKTDYYDKLLKYLNHSIETMSEDKILSKGKELGIILPNSLIRFYHYFGNCDEVMNGFYKFFSIEEIGILNEGLVFGINSENGILGIRLKDLNSENDPKVYYTYEKYNDEEHWFSELNHSGSEAFFFNIAAIICYLQKERIKYSTLAILTILSTIIFVQTNSRLTYMTTILLVFFMVYEKLLERFLPQFKKMNPIWALFIPIFLVISVFSVYITICYDPSIGWHNLLNRFLGDRLVISNRSYNIYGIPLLGNSSIEWVGQSVDVNGIKPSGAITYVDNLFFNILQQYGIVTLFAVVILCTIMMYRCYQLGDRILMMILVILALHAFFDGIIQQLQYNSFLHFIYYLCARYAYMESERSKEEQERRKLLSTGYLNNGLWSRIRKRCLAGAAAYIRRKPADGMIKKE